MNDRMRFRDWPNAQSERVNRSPHDKRGIAALLTFWLLAIPFSAVAVASDSQISSHSTRHLTLSYEVHAGGLHIFSFDVGLALEPDGYRIVAAGGTRGISSYLYKWDVSLKAEGDGKRPGRYMTVNTSRPPIKTMELEFVEDGSFSVTRNVPESPDETAEEQVLPAQLPANIADPLSASLMAVKTLAATGSCVQIIPVFDGKRRFDVLLHDAGTTDLPKSRLSSYEGPAILCGLGIQRISGFKKPRRHVGQWDQDKDEPPKLWIAQVRPDMPPVLVRFTGALALGSIVVHLTKVESSQEFASTALP